MTNQTFDSMAIFSNKLIITAINHNNENPHKVGNYDAIPDDDDVQWLSDGNNVLTRMLFALREEGGVNGGQNEPWR